MEKIKIKIKRIIYIPIDILISASLIYSNFLSKFNNKLYFDDKIERKRKKYVNLKLDDSTNLKFYTVNSLTKFRAETFFEKEPDTIKWIKNYNDNGDLLILVPILVFTQIILLKLKKAMFMHLKAHFIT